MCNCDNAAVEEWLITDALEFVDWVLDPVVLVFIICMYFCLCLVNISVTVTNLFKSGCNRKLNIRQFSMCYQVWQVILTTNIWLWNHIHTWALVKSCNSLKCVSQRWCIIARSLAGSPLTLSSSGYGFSLTLWKVWNGTFK